MPDPYSDAWLPWLRRALIELHRQEELKRPHHGGLRSGPTSLPCR
jgi:hypothetical protein